MDSPPNPEVLPVPTSLRDRSCGVHTIILQFQQNFAQKTTKRSFSGMDKFAELCGRNARGNCLNSKSCVPQLRKFNMAVSEGDVRARLEALEPEHVEIKDFSDGCGLKFDVLIVSDQFEGKPLLQRHRLVNNLLKKEMESIHALTLNTLTKKQWEEKQAASKS
ncbi:unnamed protein product [Dibothriocephalus latus]|uniref:Uncharacterized protein n=1 Tax=Dibothriocephalus latus TaxID=60516 RepID=A0A3P7LXT5_DIBLA|nr:unnamed protein product [Dibothriocephalus latus]